MGSGWASPRRPDRRRGAAAGEPSRAGAGRAGGRGGDRAAARGGAGPAAAGGRVGDDRGGGDPDDPEPGAAGLDGAGARGEPWARGGHLLGGLIAGAAPLLASHLALVLVALAVAVAIGLPLAVVLVRRPRAAGSVMTVAGAIQTIPSLALLALMVPVLAASHGLGVGISSAA